ncbi:MAG: hypothetical protein KIT09_23715 [Bryobacteraceae bacterium]|nr:hypothetical protein [Bryobacteraceae bacterium]
MRGQAVDLDLKPWPPFATVPAAIGRRRRRAVRYQRMSPISGIPPLLPLQLLGLLAAVAPAVVACLPARARPEAPPASRIEMRIATEGLDRQQRRMPFTIYVLSHERSWKFESATDLEEDQPLIDPELEAAIRRAHDVFCVGTASLEGAAPKEEARAAQRALRLARWVTAALRDEPRPRVYALNAGQYVGPPELDSSGQRKAVLFVTEPHDDDVDLESALRSGLQRKQSEHPVIHRLLLQYSRSSDWLRSLRPVAWRQ